MTTAYIHIYIVTFSLNIVALVTVATVTPWF